MCLVIAVYYIVYHHCIAPYLQIVVDNPAKTTKTGIITLTQIKAKLEADMLCFDFEQTELWESRTSKYCCEQHKNAERDLRNSAMFLLKKTTKKTEIQFLAILFRSFGLLATKTFKLFVFRL